MFAGMGYTIISEGVVTGQYTVFPREKKIFRNDHLK
jgi:hypothetical protein